MTTLPSPLATALADRYRLGRELGHGGMATVYLAHDLRHDRSVALKVLLPEIATALGPERFQREIKLAARLQHPHILTVYDSGEAAGQLWFTMPYVEGESLRGRIFREKQLPVDEALRIAREVAEALDYAHHHGVIHRDVKPENILLTGSHALVADFGIARALGGSEQPLTATGVAIGTPAYMSPEQASGTRDLDARTDVYSLGCVLFEMLAGEPPYTGPTAQAIIARALTETPRPIRPMRRGVPEALDAVIAKAMVATPADRYASAAEFARALEPVFNDAERETRGLPILRALTQRPLFVMLAFGFLVGLGVLFAWRGSHAGGDATGAKLVAVLPFENLGTPEDEYIADGITDEVRGRLSTVSGVQVIARGSSMSYKKATKPPQQIAQELGVRYLLTATVRWETASAGAKKVHLSPELVEVRSGSTPQTMWQQSFDVDASLADVFQMYADVAGRVAQALGVALGDSARRQLVERPTQNPAAYDAFLKGEEVRGSGATDPLTPRRAAAYYAEAVALDPGFVQAWAQLSRAHSLLYYNSGSKAAEAEQALRAAERALALAPNRGDGHIALGWYFWAVPKDNARAAEEFTRGLKVAPNDVDVLTSSAMAELELGRWESALTRLQRAQALDRRSAPTATSLAYVLLCQKRYSEAREAADRAVAVAPTDLFAIRTKAMVALAQGDLAGAREVITAVPKEVDPAALVAQFAIYSDLFWALNDVQQQLLLHLSPHEFDDNRGIWASVFAETYWLRGAQAKARAYADSAIIAGEQDLRAAPGDAQGHAFFGLMLAYLGRKTDAIREGQRSVALMPIGKSAEAGPYFQHQLARIYVLVGEPEKALDQLEPLLKIPYYLSPGWLKIDPTFDPLRSNPRFQRLVAGR